jgi:hypothetical protein
MHRSCDKHTRTDRESGTTIFQKQIKDVGGKFVGFISEQEINLSSK